MDGKIRELLNDEIKILVQEINGLETGTKEKTAAINDLAALCRIGIDEDKDDVFFKRKQLEEQVKDRYFRIGIAAVEIVLPLIFYAVWMHKGFKFEETGTYTSTTFRGLFNRFKPTRK